MANVKRPRKDLEDNNSSLSNSSGSDELSNDDDNESSSSVESGLVSADVLLYNAGFSYNTNS